MLAVVLAAVLIRMRLWTHPEKLATYRNSNYSSIFLRRIVSLMFMRVNSWCAHQVRPPPGRVGWCSAVGKCLATDQELPSSSIPCDKLHRDATLCRSV